MLEEFASILNSGGNTVFFGGAGVSTESGIPDFRSETGLYRARQKYGRPPEELLSHRFFARHPEIFFAYYRENLIHSDAKPNAAHIALAKLERKGKLSAVITQNIDGLHQAAGSVNVLELHGSVWRNYCLACGEQYSLEAVMSAKSGVPKCAKCGGVVRPDVVLYEEPLNDEVVSAAIEAIRKANTLIVGGTSLAVYPAAGLLRYFEGDAIVLINRTETPYDARAKLVFHDPIGKVFAGVLPLCEGIIPICDQN